MSAQPPSWAGGLRRHSLPRPRLRPRRLRLLGAGPADLPRAGPDRAAVLCGRLRRRGRQRGRRPLRRGRPRVRHLAARRSAAAAFDVAEMFSVLRSRSGWSYPPLHVGVVVAPDWLLHTEPPPARGWSASTTGRSASGSPASGGTGGSMPATDAIRVLAKPRPFSAERADLCRAGRADPGRDRRRRHPRSGLARPRRRADRRRADRAPRVGGVPAAAGRLRRRSHRPARPERLADRRHDRHCRPRHHRLGADLRRPDRAGDRHEFGLGRRHRRRRRCGGLDRRHLRPQRPGAAAGPGGEQGLRQGQAGLGHRRRAQPRRPVGQGAVPARAASG